MSYPVFTSLADVRLRIDAIDRQLVALIAERGACVAQAAGFTDFGRLERDRDFAAVLGDPRYAALR